MGVIPAIQQDRIRYRSMIGSLGAGEGGIGGGASGNVRTPPSGGSAVAGDPLDVRACTTGNITLSGSQTIDGVTLDNGDYLLVNNQTDKTENGPYVYDDGGSTYERVLTGFAPMQFVRVREGTAYDNTVWVLSNDDEPDVGTDDIEYTQVGTVTGSGTNNRVTKWDSTGIAITDSQIHDTGSYVSVPQGATTGGRFNVTESGTIHTVNARYTGSTVDKAALYGESSNANGAAILGVHTGGSYAAEFQSASGRALEVSGSEAARMIGTTTTSDAVTIGSSASTTGRTCVINGTNSSQTGDVLYVAADGQGRIARFYRGGATTNDHAVYIKDDNAGSTKNALRVENDGTDTGAVAGYFVSNGAAAIIAAPTKHYGVYVYRNSSAPTSQLMLVWDDHASTNKDTAVIRTDGTGVSPIKAQQGTTDIWSIIATASGGGVMELTKVGLRMHITAKSANYTITEEDVSVGALTSTATGNMTLTLPSAPSDGWWCKIWDAEGNAGTNSVTLGRNGNTINGAAGNVTYNTNNFELIIWHYNGDYRTM